MNRRSEGGCSQRKNGDCWRWEPLDNLTNDSAKRSVNEVEIDEQCKIWPGRNTKSDEVGKSDQVLHRLPAGRSQQPLSKRYSRTQSETMIGYRAVTNPTRLKRVLSATEIKTRLAGCPQGLLIATEAPKSGESYRRRSNTEVLSARNPRSPSHDGDNEAVRQGNSDWLQEKETILLQLAVVKREREELYKENEKLQEELENRNKVIDHLIDFMKSSIPGESQQFGDDFNETLTSNNDRNRTQTFDKV